MMSEEETMVTELHSLLEPLHARAHELGYRLTGFTLEKQTEQSAHNFAGCTTTCGPQPDGTTRCTVHCP